MEAWRNELYNSLSHSVEGSTWANHKYVAIINGRYIYPEDLQKERASKSGIIAGGAKSVKSSGASVAESLTETGQDSSKNNPVAPENIIYNEKGKVKNYRHLPKNPEIGDVYYLEDTKQEVYWNGEIWTPYKRTKKKSKGKWSGGNKTADDSISKETIDRIRSITITPGLIKDRNTVKLNPDSPAKKRSSVTNFGGGR